MAKSTLYKYVKDSTYTITDEEYVDCGASTFQLGTVKRIFKGGSDMVINTAAAGAGTALTETTDYTLENEDFTYTAETGYQCFTGIKIVNATYQTGSLFISYKATGSYTDSNSIEIIIGEVRMHSAETLPSANWQWGRGGSLLRSGYTDLVEKYFREVDDCTITNGADAVVAVTGHLLTTGACISFSTTDALPTGLSVNTMYFVIYKSANDFYVASSLANALAGTKIATSSAGSGTHTLISNPWGFADSTHFYLPDFQAVVPKGFAPAGGRSVGGNTKYSPALGASEEDRIQGHFHDFYRSGAGGASNSMAQGSTQNSGSTGILNAITDGTNGNPRYGTTTRENSAGVNFIVRVI